MKRKRILLGGVGIAATAVLAGFAAVDASGSDAGASPRSSLTLLAPAAPGGGWDTASREAQQAMRAESIVNNVQVVNAPGAGGAIGLSQFADMPADPTQLMMTGTVMLGAINMNASDADLSDTTPIARLAEDYEVLIVPADSPYEDYGDFLEAWIADPHGMAVGGGGMGGTDHLLAGLIARESGIDPTEMNYISYAGGGEVLTALLSHTVDVGISSYNEFQDQIEAGNLRALALSAEEPVPAIDVPTLIEQGTDVALPNWRGLVARGGITDEQREELIAIVEELVASATWQDALERNNWVPSVITGDEFAAFIEEDQARVDAIIEELGL
ncbi:tripartite tricarboxylate transporter substrate binding protein [Microbacterium sp. Marseille-Q6965]|uniref:Bug family tripartite tricarboxylate transporter substrate binding protein n=1 Tax=Microbacterium sp. Marseille-Q6965 TaxID=2965072 RepID=UPI0021B6FC6C|nr:tripartite tricarboxylate transporter substrate-binding protein [Microbacterium sp. Marseille-Q6965]